MARGLCPIWSKFGVGRVELSSFTCTDITINSEYGCCESGSDSVMKLETKLALKQQCSSVAL